MKLILFSLLVGVTLARPQSSEKDAAVVRDDRNEFENGAYSFDFETSNGIQRSEAGQSEGETGAVNMAGEMTYPLPDGQTFYLKYVADASGFKPESPFLPEAPAFPHPIPKYVLDQIAFAAEEDKNRKLDPLRGDYVGYDRK